MSKPRFKLRLVKKERPLGPLTRAEKLAAAIGYLRERGLYLLDRGTPRPRWGLPNEQPRELNEALARKINDADRRRTK